jgi:2-polyprenyl-3-methyl-5-hydroxy-6-metoxy-1,4-benzoquinol methylase
MDSSELKKTYDAIVEQYADKEFNNPVMEKHYQKFLELLHNGSRILVVGCGPGHAVKRFSDEGHYVTGVDLSKRMLEYAEKKVESAEFYCMDVQNLTFEKKFDAIWAASVLIHVPKEKHKEILSNLMKLLQPTGVLFFGMLEGKGEQTVPDHYNKKLKNYLVFMDREEVEALMAEIGFEQYDYSTDTISKYGQKMILSFNYATRV